MNALRIIRYVAWGAVAVVAAATGYFAWQWQSGSGPTRLSIASIGGPFSLTDQKGAAVTDASLKGHPSVMFFGYTYCPDVCPTTLFEMTAWLDTLGPEADKLEVYFVTVDPERDTVEKMAEYLTSFDPRITGLTGSPEAVAEMTKAYRIYSRKVPVEGGSYIMDHTASVYLLDKDGAFTGTIDYKEAPETAVAKLKRLVEAS
jgi:protein SCO1/2